MHDPRPLAARIAANARVSCADRARRMQDGHALVIQQDEAPCAQPACTARGDVRLFGPLARDQYAAAGAPLCRHCALLWAREADGNDGVDWVAAQLPRRG